MTRTELLQAVIEEAKLLKQHATETERAELNFDNLDPSRVDRCIYGQMAGHCFNDRATKLMRLCANTYFERITPITGEYKNIPELNSRQTHRNFSPIEKYIAQPFAKNEVLINFLKGKTDELTLEDLS